MKKTLAIVLALLMAASLIAFTACGKKETVTDDSDNKDVQNEQNVGENASTDDQNAGDETKADSDLAYVTDKGTLVVGITEYAPMNYQEDGQWTGFDTEFAEAVAAKLGVKVEFVEIDWDNKVFELNSKAIDCVWNGMTLTNEVLSSMNCSKPYVVNAQVLVMNKDKIADYTTVESLKDLTFVAEAGSAGAARTLHWPGVGTVHPLRPPVSDRDCTYAHCRRTEAAAALPAAGYPAPGPGSKSVVPDCLRWAGALRD